MTTRWQKLKELETAAFAARKAGTIDKWIVLGLRRALRSVEDLPDAEHAIVFHGAWALVHEFDGNTADAIRHRTIEVAKIRQLHAAEPSIPAGKCVFRGYGIRFLAPRQRVLAQLRASSKTSRRR